MVQGREGRSGGSWSGGGSRIRRPMVQRGTGQVAHGSEVD